MRGKQVQRNKEGLPLPLSLSASEGDERWRKKEGLTVPLSHSAREGDERCSTARARFDHDTACGPAREETDL